MASVELIKEPTADNMVFVVCENCIVSGIVQKIVLFNAADIRRHPDHHIKIGDPCYHVKFDPKLDKKNIPKGTLALCQDVVCFTYEEANQAWHAAAKLETAAIRVGERTKRNHLCGMSLQHVQWPTVHHG